MLDAHWRITLWSGAVVLAALLLSGFGSSHAMHFTGTIAFVARNGEQADLYVSRADGKGRRQLTHDALEEGAPTWAPDGKSIAFVATRFGVGGQSHGDAISTITVVGTNGSRRRALFRARSSQLALNDLAWSPDGRLIAFTWFRNEKSQLWLLRPARKSIASVTSAAQQPTWAPDSKRLAYAGSGRIFVVNVNTRKAHRVRGAFESACPVWSPNGRWIAVCSDSPGSNNQFSALDVMTPAGAHRRELVKSSFVMPVAWSPKSDAILFLGADKSTASGRALFIVSLRDGQVTAIPGTAGAIGSASWHR